MAITNIYTPEEMEAIVFRLSTENLTVVEQMEVAYLVSEFTEKMEAFWDKHDKLGKLSINFDV